MVLHQAVEPTLFLADEYTRANNLTRGNILESVSPWLKTISNMDLTKLGKGLLTLPWRESYSLIRDNCDIGLSEMSERIRSLTKSKEEININDIPKVFFIFSD